MEICGEDKQKTIHSINEAYREVTGKIANIRSYKNKEEFLAATENQNLPEDVKQEVCKAGFPLTVYTLKFQSKQHQNFQAEIQDLIKNRKLRYLGKAPTNTNSTQPSPTPMEQGTLTAKSSPSSFFEPIPIPTQPSLSTSTDHNLNQDRSEQSKKNSMADNSQSDRTNTPSLKILRLFAYKFNIG